MTVRETALGKYTAVLGVLVLLLNSPRGINLLLSLRIYLVYNSTRYLVRKRTVKVARAAINGCGYVQVRVHTPVLV